MKDAAVNVDRFQEWPVLGIYTVKDYFANRRPDLPLAAQSQYGVALFDIIPNYIPNPISE